MKFGIHYAYWEHEWSFDFFPALERAARIGFDILETNSAGIAAQSDAQLDELKSMAEEKEITLTTCIGLSGEYNTASPDAAVRRAGNAYVRRIMEAMHKAGIKSLGGITYGYWPADYSKPFDKQAEWKFAVESMREQADMAQSYGITLLPEVVNRFEGYLFNDTQEALRFLDEVNKPNVKLLLDTFHMNIEEDFFGEAIRMAGRNLAHLHVGEANRKVPGKGHMPWKEIMTALKDIGYDGNVVMEPFVRCGGAVGHDIKVWRDMSEGADIAKLDKELSGALDFLKSLL